MIVTAAEDGWPSELNMFGIGGCCSSMRSSQSKERLLPTFVNFDVHKVCIAVVIQKLPAVLISCLYSADPTQLVVGSVC